MSKDDQGDLELIEGLLSPHQHEQQTGDAQELSSRPTCRKRWKKSLKNSSLTMVIISLIIYAFFVGILAGNHWKSRVIDLVCQERTSRPTPLMPPVHPHWTEIAFNGSLFRESLYRHSAGAEVDAAWEALGVDYRPVVVPEISAKSMGLENHIRVNKRYGGGLLANVEGLHHLHCLNLLRQALYFNAEHYRSQGKGAWKNEEWLVGKHITHCLDIIRQQLMCTVDMGVMGQIWVHEAKSNDARPFVDFNTLHVCRDFEAVRSWAEAHQVEEEVPEDFLEPPDEGMRVYTAIP